MRWGRRSGGALLVALAIVGTAVAAACGGSDGASRSDDSGGPGGAPVASGREGDQYTGDMSNGGTTGVAPSDGSFGEAQPPAVAGDKSTGDAAALPQLLDRKLIRTATVNIETDRVLQKFEQVGNIAAAAGGVVSSSSFGTDGEFQTASITIRVPGERYQEVINELRGLGDVRTEQSSANDVTEEYTDLQSRLRNLQATEAQYLTLLQRAETINDILIVQDRLNVVRSEIEQVQGRIQLLSNQTELATITVHLAPPALQPKPEEKNAADTPLEVAREAFQASLAVLQGIATVALAVVAFSWWLLPLGVAGLFFARRQLRGDRDGRQAPPPAPSA